MLRQIVHRQVLIHPRQSLKPRHPPWPTARWPGGLGPRRGRRREAPAQTCSHQERWTTARVTSGGCPHPQIAPHRSMRQRDSRCEGRLWPQPARRRPMQRAETASPLGHQTCKSLPLTSQHVTKLTGLVSLNVLDGRLEHPRISWLEGRGRRSNAVGPPERCLVRAARRPSSRGPGCAGSRGRATRYGGPRRQSCRCRDIR